jgi:hypothetical protein
LFLEQILGHSNCECNWRRGGGRTQLGKSE